MCTCGALRSESQVIASERSSTTRKRHASLSETSEVSAALVEGLSPETRQSTTWMRSLRARSERAPRRAAAFIFLGVRWL